MHTLSTAIALWLLTKSGLVGLVELEAAEPKTAGYVGGELRFGPDLPLTKDETGAYHCGAVTMRLLESNFATVETGPARPGYAQKSTAHSAVNLWTAGKSFDASPGAPLRYAAVIAPDGAPSPEEFRRIESPDLWGFQVRLSGKRFAVAFNPGDSDVALDLAWVKAKVAAKTVAMLSEN